MRDLGCKDARLWLQAPDDLVAAEAALLHAHLAECSECADIKEQYAQLDRLILQSLNATLAAESVRPAVRARLEARTPEPGPTTVGHRWRRRAVPRLAWVAVAVAALAAVLAGLVPQLLPSGQTPETASAAWRLVRADIAYPVTVDPVRPDHLLAGALGQVYESWNAGKSWRRLAPLPPHLAVRDLAVDASQPRRYLVAVKHSVFVSRDAGRHWKVTVSNLQGVFNMFLMEDPRTAGTFYLGPSILWKSADHGATWTRAGTGMVFAPYGIQALSVQPNGALLTGIWGGGVALSRDGGRTWLRLTHGLRRNVLDVTVAHDGTLWAATDRGAYFSRDRGRHWHRAGIAHRFFTTSLLDGGTYLLAGGNGGLYRSTDGGRHWRLSMLGLPLDPYLYRLVADPHRQRRVYAALNSDGVFRSDDGGLHWAPINNGLPLNATGGAEHLILFRRDGALWITNGVGTDPTVLTVERTVKLASLSPDGSTAVYAATTPGGWAVRTLAAGGSAARTVQTGSGALPKRLLWSPDSSLLAVIGSGEVTISNLSRDPRRWRIPARERLIGWSGSGRTLLFWNASDGRMRYRSWTSGRLVAMSSTAYPVAPLPAPDGRHLAFIWSGRLHVGTWETARSAGGVGSSCRLDSWSDDSARLLLRCGSGVEERTATGTVVIRTTLPAQPLWVPGSHRNLLFFHRGQLWRWSPGGQAHRIVLKAEVV